MTLRTDLELTIQRLENASEGSDEELHLSLALVEHDSGQGVALDVECCE